MGKIGLRDNDRGEGPGREFLWSLFKIGVRSKVIHIAVMTMIQPFTINIHGERLLKTRKTEVIESVFTEQFRDKLHPKEA
jgi:hypothetical protein